MVSNEKEYETVMPPGETLQEVLDDRGWTQKELADRLGVTPKHVNEIVQGKAPISQKLAHDLELVLGVSATFWNNYEAAYRAYLTRLEEAQRLSAQVEKLAKMPWRKAMRAGWIDQGADLVGQLRIVLSYFRVANLDQYNELYQSPAVAFKKHLKFESDPDALAFWLRRGEQLGETIEAKPFDKDAFTAALGEVRKLTFETAPEVFVPRLQGLCSECGVVVVLVPELSGTCVFGATRWLTQHKALIQLSLRRKSNDFLWFTFFHEAAHILKHGKKAVFIEGGQEDELEKEADRFAQDILIPAVQLRTFLESGHYSRGNKPNLAAIRTFAEQVGIAPGVVVGRLQREGILANADFNSKAGPKVYYEWSS